MYKNIFRESVTLYNIANSLYIYNTIDVPLVESIKDWYGFMEDMKEMSS